MKGIVVGPHFVGSVKTFQTLAENETGQIQEASLRPQAKRLFNEARRKLSTTIRYISTHGLDELQNNLAYLNNTHAGMWAGL